MCTLESPGLLTVTENKPPQQNSTSDRIILCGGILILECKQDHSSPTSRTSRREHGDIAALPQACHLLAPHMAEGEAGM